MNMAFGDLIRPVGVTCLLYLAMAVSVFAQSTTFTYQGHLKNAGVNANGSYDFIFQLYDALSGGTQLGPSLIRDAVVVTEGSFTVSLDFGSQFPGAGRFLQILVRQQPNIHTQLAPRQPITSIPYSIKSLNAETSTNALQLGGVASNQFVLTGDARLTDARSPLPGSPNYIANTTPGGGSGFTITGTGSANIVDVISQFNIGGSRVLSIGGTRNTFAGVNTGPVNTGFDNAFFGSNAGQNNQVGTRNAFFGSGAGRANTGGGSNTFVGTDAGSSNTTGASNSYFGNSAGLSNTTGTSNSIFGESAGVLGTSGSHNSIFGWVAGFSNTGDNNTFVGSRAGGANTIGGSNTFIGQGAGQNNTSASQNSFVGMGAGMGNTLASFNTYVGFNAGFTNQTGPGNTFVGWRAGFGTTGGSNSFFGESVGATNTTGTGNAFFAGGTANTTGGSNSFFGSASGSQNTTGSTNTFIGVQAGSQNTTGNSNVYIGFAAGNPGASQVNNSVAIGAMASVNTSNTIVLGTNLETTRIPGKFIVGANSSLLSGIGYAETFTSNGVNGIFTGNFVLTGIDSILASPVHLCIRTQVLTTIGGGSTGGQVLTRCSVAFGPDRLKQNVRPFPSGLSVIKRLRPVAFEWKEDGSSDIGLNTDDVAAVEPDLVTRNAAGQPESVKEHGLDVLFINAIKEQQTQIESQQKQIDQQNDVIERQRAEVDALRALVCLQNPTASVCKPIKR